MKQPTTIYLVRHGETKWNVEQRLQGQTDSPLTEKGLHQAHQIAEQFEHIKFAGIYSSDIGRAKTTAEIIAQYHKKEVQISELIRERCFGKYEGMLSKDMAHTLKPKFEAAKELTKAERLSFQLDDGVETDQQLIDRLYKFFKLVHQQFPNQKVLTVSHGALMRVFLIYLDVARYGQMGYSSMDNLGYLVITTDGESVELLMAHGIHLNSMATDGG